jgi:hypothetical protein
VKKERERERERERNEESERSTHGEERNEAEQM